MGIWTALSLVDVDSIGAGGGSVGWTDARGMLRVGPHSAGAVPGPACYGRGGIEPTVTDALLVLGYLAPDRFLGGDMAGLRLRVPHALRVALLAGRRLRARRFRPLGPLGTGDPLHDPGCECAQLASSR